jgi:hypothetical protein
MRADIVETPELGNRSYVISDAGTLRWEAPGAGPAAAHETSESRRARLALVRPSLAAAARRIGWNALLRPGG